MTTTKIFEKIVAKRVEILKLINKNFWLMAETYSDLIKEAWSSVLEQFAADEEYLAIASDNNCYMDTLLVLNALQR